MSCLPKSSQTVRPCSLPSAPSHFVDQQPTIPKKEESHTRSSLFSLISSSGSLPKAGCAFPGTLCLLSLSLMLYCSTLFHYVAAYKQHDFPLPIHLPTMAAAKTHSFPALLLPSGMLIKLSLSFKRILKNKDLERPLNI